MRNTMLAAVTVAALSVVPAAASAQAAPPEPVQTKPLFTSFDLVALATELQACKQLIEWSERVGGAYEKQIAATYIADVGRSLRAHIDLGACQVGAPLRDAAL